MKNLAARVLTAISLLAIVLQSFTPYIAYLPKAYAQEETPTVTDSPTPTPDQSTPTVTETPTPDQTTPTVTETPAPDQTVNPTPTPTDVPTDTVTPTPTDTPTDTVTPTPTDVTPTDTVTPTDNSPPANSDNSSNNNSNSSNNQSSGETSVPASMVSPTVTPTPEPPTGNEQLNMTILKNVSAPTIDLEAVVAEGSASLTTDKPDYAPTDTVLLTGANLLPNTTYTLQISSSDEPPIGVSAQVTSDENGKTAYAYQLDGNYRPNYKAELRDESGTIVATTTFTDSVTGPDLTVTKINSVGGNATQNVSFNWILTITNNGNSTATFTNNSTVLKDDLPTSGATYGSVTSVKSAGTTGNNNCTISSNTLTCGSGNGSNRLTIPAGEFVTVTVPVTPTAVGTLTNPRNAGTCKVDPDSTNGVVSESNEGNNTCSDSVTVTQPTGILTVIKHVVGTVDASNWLIHIKNSSNQEMVTPFPGNEGGVNASLPAGQYTITETGSITGYDLSYSGCDSSGVITVTAGNTSPIICTLTNTKRTTITVFKFTTPSNDPTSFPISISATGNGQIFGATTGSVSTTSPFTFSVTPGTYHITETVPSGWTQDTANSGCETVTVGIGDQAHIIWDAACNIFNVKQTGSLKVNKLLDNDGNGSYETPNPAAFTWSVNGSGTNVMGSTISLNPGSYNINENTVAGYHTAGWYRNGGEGSCSNRDSSSLPASIDIFTGQTTEITICNVINKGSISGYKYEDQDGNAQTTDDTNPINGWSISLWQQVSNSWSHLTDTTTDANGHYSFANLLPGVYQVREGSQTNWTNLSPTTIDVTLGAGNDSANNNFLNTTVESDKVTLCHATGSNSFVQITVSKSGAYHGHWSNHENDIIPTFTYNGGTYSLNYDALGQAILRNDCNPNVYGSIHGFKWNDLNGNGVRDENEPLLSGWTIFIDTNHNGQLDEGEPSFVTSDSQDHFGWYWFENLLFGNYSICEVHQPGWNQTYPEGCHSVTLPDGNSNVTANAVIGPEYNFGNRNMTPKLTISKVNDAGGVKSPGDTVTYTLRVTASREGGPADNVTVTDLLPNGFHYVTGSWQALLNGVLNPAITEPTYHSPGVWTLGHMNTGDVYILSYKVNIDGGQASGTYYDNAWAQGTPVGDPSNVQLALAVNPGYLDTNFVGTEVAVSNPNQVSSSYANNTTQQVLGAAVGPELPSTGENSLWVVIATLVSLMGLGTLILGIKLKKKYE